MNSLTLKINHSMKGLEIIFDGVPLGSLDYIRIKMIFIYPKNIYRKIPSKYIFDRFLFQ